MSTGIWWNLDWFEEKLKKRYEAKVNRVGERREWEKVVKVLYRIIGIELDGCRLETDQRHVEILVDELSLKDAKEKKLPGEDDKEWELEGDQEELEPRQATRFRALAARLNYLAADRLDVQFATKRIC